MQQYKKTLGKVMITPQGAWRDDKDYDILSVVNDNSTDRCYISKCYVPIGVTLDNSEYWMPLNVAGYSDTNFMIISKKRADGQLESFTIETAIASIAEVNRKVGCIICFFNNNTDRLDIGGSWEIWQFNDTNLYNWNDVNSWVNIYYNYNKFVGWFANETKLKTRYKYPHVGMYAYVGTQLNEAVVYRCDVETIWSKTSETAKDYVKVIVKGNVSIGENGNWFVDGIDTCIPASVKGDNGKTPYFRNNANKLEYSYDEIAWYEISDYLAHYYRYHNNKLQHSNDNTIWEDVSDYISAWFRWSSDNKIQISRDGHTWSDLSNVFSNNLHISRYIGADETLPTSGVAEGTIYAKGPTYADGDISHANPIYRLWVYAWKGNTLAWQDNGEFTSIAAGVVQETGDSETEVMSQKATTQIFSELSSKVGFGDETITWEYVTIGGAVSNIRLTSSRINVVEWESYEVKSTGNYQIGTFGYKEGDDNYVVIKDYDSNYDLVIPKDIVSVRFSIKMFDETKITGNPILHCTIKKKDIEKVNLLDNIVDSLEWENIAISTGAQSNVRLTSSKFHVKGKDKYVFKAEYPYYIAVFGYREGDEKYVVLKNFTDKDSIIIPNDIVSVRFGLKGADEKNINQYATKFCLIVKDFTFEDIERKVYIKNITENVAWVNKSIGGVQNNARLTSGLFTSNGDTYKISCNDGGHVFSVFGIKEDNTYDVLFDSVNNSIFKLNKNYVGFKISIRTAIDGGKVDVSVASKIDVIENYITQTTSTNNVNIKFQVASYNVMYYFSNKIEAYNNITDEQRDNWVINFKKIMNKIAHSDVLFVQEDNSTFYYKDSTTSKSSYDALYKQFYPYRYQAGYGLPSIYSKHPLNRTRIVSIATSSYTRNHAYAEINVNGETIVLLSIHCGIMGNNGLIEEFNALIEELKGYDKVIIGGDTNSDVLSNGTIITPSVEGYNDLINNTFVAEGYTTANWGYWGNFKTWEEPFKTGTGTGAHDKCIDTFIVKGLSIDSFDVIAHELGDHYPIMSNLTILPAN